MTTTSELVSVQQIAVAVGMNARTVRDSMAGVKPAGKVNRSGNLCDGFTFEQLPERFRDSIARQAEALRYRSPNALLADPKPQWKPETPLHRQPPEMIEHAHKLQRALAFFLQHRNNVALGEDNLTARAVADYEAAFGKPVSARHVREMISRVLERDGGREEFQRVELYLPHKAASDCGKDKTSYASKPVAFPLLEDAIQCVEDISAMTVAERSSVWRATLDEYCETVGQGEKPKRAKKMVLTFLQNRAPHLAVGWDALRKQFDFRLSAFHAEGVAGLCDKRKGRSGRPRKGTEDLSPDELLLLSRANSVGGGISQAFRELHLGIEVTPGRVLQFSADFRAAYPFDPRKNKSYVPQSLRTKLRPLLKSIEPLNHGPKTARLAAPSIHRDWNKVAAGAWYQSDDETANHYVWFECEDGEYEYGGMRFDVLRPQILPLVDVRTDYVLSVLLLCQRNYNSRAIRSLILKTCMDERVGMPFDGFYFEQGIWKSRNVQALVSWTEIDEAFSRAGLSLRLRHATTPKAKIIERIFSQEQNKMQELPGYAGRDERNDGFERVRAFVASLKKVGQPRKEEINPAAGLLSAEQYLDFLERAYERFNHEPQNGERLQGMSPAEAWEKLSGGRPHRLVPDSLRYLLATEQTARPVTVTREGICLRFGGEKRYFFENARLGLLIGEKVNVRWNPDFPDHVIVVHPASDPHGQRPFTVPLDTRLDALNASEEDFLSAKRSRRVFTQPQRSLFRMIQHTYGKTIREDSLGTPALRAAGVAHQKAEEDAAAMKPSREAQEARARALARKAGIDPSKIKHADRAAGLAELSELDAKIRELEAKNQQP